MIFVTVGSQKFQFDRLIKAIDQLIKEGKIKDKVFAQTGACKYIPKNYAYKPYLDRDEFNDFMNKSSIVITHGGTGAIVGALKAGKKVIAVPRLSRYGEHVDDHQIQLIEEFVKCNFIMSCDNLNNLDILIEQIKDKDFNTFNSNTQQYLDVIENYLK
ncbi:MAG: beta(1,3)galactosyltransferase EpsH [Erysipelotrichaceae bacterium]|nr:beta(1,3)galactosyltransferase EpsH [Erysipelotrichaceae bacterium]